MPAALMLFHNFIICTPMIFLPSVPLRFFRVFQVTTALVLGLVLWLFPFSSPAFADEGARATLSNASSHNLGLFARYKKMPLDQDPVFYVLAPGHTTDDDYDVLALYVPANVSVIWPGDGSPRLSRTAEALPLPAGKELEVSDALSDEPTPLAYSLSLPASPRGQSVLSSAVLPNFDQTALDSEAETAPLD